MKPMKTSLIQSSDAKDAALVLLISKDAINDHQDLSPESKDSIKRDFDSDLPISVSYSDGWVIAVKTPEAKSDQTLKEKIRRGGAQVSAAAKARKIKTILVSGAHAANLAEGLFLASYKFGKYFKKDEKSTYDGIEEIRVNDPNLSEADFSIYQSTLYGTVAARDLVNEPVSFLTATELSNQIKSLGQEAGFSVEVFEKKKIEELKMGGLLAVNYGSPEPPTFSIMEWKPDNAKNEKPIVLVGKGVVYDTGGLSLKPTPNSMDLMKSDMAGSAAVIGTMYGISRAKLPLHIIALVPATDNRPGGNAYAPGDVIHMYDGTTVEVLNTDAEGRMILADALSYAKQYDPELVMDFATLTGAAARAIGPQGLVYMGTTEGSVKTEVETAGMEVHERLVEFPFWEEYGDLLKSNVADLKNIGGPYAGAITAGKFLAHFTDYPYLHFDIAGPAFLGAADGYKPKGGTGVGVRMLMEFFSKRASNA